MTAQISAVAVQPGFPAGTDNQTEASGFLAGLQRFLSTKEAAIGSGLLALMLGIVIFGPIFAPHDPNSLLATPIAPPSRAYPLGTDLFGRDLLSRFLWGGRSAMVLPMIAVSVSVALACVIGLLSGYLGGVFDAVVTRVIDIVLAVPPFLTVLMILAALGTSDTVVVLAVAYAYVAPCTRVLRAATQAVRPREFVLAARARGESTSWIVFREILPNVTPTLLVEIAQRLSWAVLSIASLSFLGLGVQPPTPNWGVMVGENRILLFTHPLAVIVPAIAIALLTVSINLIADSLNRYFGGDRGGEVLL